MNLETFAYSPYDAQASALGAREISELGGRLYRLVVDPTPESPDVSVVMRTFAKDYYSELYYENWLLCRNAGLPVVPDMNISPPDAVVMKDLCADGSSLFGKHTIIGKYSLFELSRTAGSTPPDHNESTFAHVNPSNIHQRSNEIARRATQEGILLAQDDPSVLLMHPDGTWEVILLDLEGCRKNNSPPLNALDVQDLGMRNDDSMRKGYNNIIRAQNYILSVLREEKCGIQVRQVAQ